MSSKLYVGNLTYQTTDEGLQGVFEDGGFTVQSVNVIMDRQTGRSKGFGFVELDSPESAQSAINALDGKDVDGRNIKVNVAQDKPRRDDGGRRERY